MPDIPIAVAEDEFHGLTTDPQCLERLRALVRAGRDTRILPDRRPVRQVLSIEELR